MNLHIQPKPSRKYASTIRKRVRHATFTETQLPSSRRAHDVEWTYCCETSTLPTHGKPNHLRRIETLGTCLIRAYLHVTTIGWVSNYTTENSRLGFSPYLQLKSWYFISNYCSFKLSAPITIIHYPGPGGGPLLSVAIISSLSVVFNKQCPTLRNQDFTDNSGRLAGAQILPGPYTVWTSPLLQPAALGRVGVGFQ